MISILSTKKLSLAHKKPLLGPNVTFQEYDAISIELIEPKTPKNVKNAIFSSKNAIKSLKKFQNELFSENIQNCFCVGASLETILNENGQKVIKMEENAHNLSNFITKNYQNEEFYFFCGNKRRDEIPMALKKAKIALFEVESYKTKLNSIKIDQKFDGILFFSPSAVESFTTLNNLENATAFCIGETTASEAKKHTHNIVVANSQTTKSVITNSINYFTKEN